MNQDTHVFRMETVEILPLSPPFRYAKLKEMGISGLHFGSGRSLQVGWLNADTALLTDPSGNETPTDQVTLCDGRFYYLRHDAAEPLPIESESFEYAYSEHMIEHLSQSAAISWLTEIRRLLKPGGFVRISTPDLARYAQGYLDPEGSFFREQRQRLLALGMKNVPQRRAWMFNQAFYKWGHQWLYDLDEIVLLAEAAGFAKGMVAQCAFRQGQSLDVAKLDSGVRNAESLYVEIAKR